MHLEQIALRTGEWWLTKRERQMLDSFHCSCLRKTDRISHSMVSRVSNKYVLDKFGSIPLSNVLLRRQLLYYGKVARLPGSSILRSLVFEPNTCDIRRTINRRRGRPRFEWSAESEKVVHRMVPDEEKRAVCLLDENLWHRKVWQFTELLAI